MEIYWFGAVQVLLEEKAQPIEHNVAVALDVLEQFFGYRRSESFIGARALAVGSVDRSSPLNQIIWKGCDGFLDWRKRRGAGEAAGFVGLIKELQRGNHSVSLKDCSLNDRMAIQEDCKLLQAFYPDPAQRDRAHYAFAHHFLPGYIHSNPLNFLRCDGAEPTRFVQARWMRMEKTFALRPLPEDLPGIMNFARVMDLEAWRADVGGHPGLFIKMPLPEGPGCAFFVGAVLMVPAALPQTWAPNSRGRVFTLERIFDLQGEEAIKTGRFCEWASQKGTLQHRNSGLGVPVTPTGFLGAVASALQHRDQIPAAATMKPPGESSPAVLTVFVPPAALPPPPETKRNWWKFW